MKKIFNLILIILMFMTIFLSVDKMALAQEDTGKNRKLTVKDMKIKENLKSIEIDMVIPVIEGMANYRVENKINQRIQNDASAFKERLLNDSIIFVTSAEEEGWRYSKYLASCYYILHLQSNSILSMSVFYYEYTLGAHGHTLQKVYNINLKNGELFTLSSLFSGMEKNSKVINREIKRQIQLHPELYFDSGEIFESISDDQSFYIIDDGIVIFFGLYEIAPYACGIRYFKIPFSLIEMNMNFNIGK